MVSYWHSVQDKNLFTYSCDMIRISLEICSENNSFTLQECINYFTNPKRTDIDIYSQNLALWKFRYMFKVNCDDSAMVFGFSLNGANSDDKYKGFVEFNPNKVMGSLQAYSDLKFVLRCSALVKVARWDLAVDIPYPRDCVSLRKDQRMFELTQKSFEDRTEYLGSRNSVGRVKVYNKTIESKLDYDLTRIEMTLGSVEKQSDIIEEFERVKPCVWLLNKHVEMRSDSDLSNTQRVLIEMLQNCENPEYYMQRLEYRIRKKIEPYVSPDNAKLSFDINCVLNIVSEIKKLINVMPMFTKQNDIRRGKSILEDIEERQDREAMEWLNGEE